LSISHRRKRRMADLRPDHIFADLIQPLAMRRALLKMTEFLRALV